MKRSFTGTILICALAYSLGCTTERPALSGEWIDLTHDFSNETVYWPTSDPFQLESVAAGMTEQGYYYSANKFCASEHGGTHLDAPVHFAEGRHTAEQIPLTRLVSPAVTIDIVAKAQNNRDYLVNTDDFREWEARHGTIPNGVIVLLYTGYGRYWPDRVKYMGTDKRGPEAVAELHFPGLHPDAARWLTENRKINAIGLDTPSIDYGQSQLFETHRVLASHDIPIFENVANLDRLSTTGSLVVALPMKIRGGTGGPLRIIALLPDRR